MTDNKAYTATPDLLLGNAIDTTVVVNGSGDSVHRQTVTAVQGAAGASAWLISGPMTLATGTATIGAAVLATGGATVGLVGLVTGSAVIGALATGSATIGGVTLQGELSELSVTGTIASANDVITLTDIGGRHYATVAFEDQSAIDAIVHVQIMNAESVWDNRFLWDGNRWSGLITVPNGTVSEPGLTCVLALEPGDQEIKAFVDTYNSGSSEITITAGNRPPAIFIAGAAGAIFINNSNPTDTDNHALLGLSVGGEDSKSVSGKVVQRVVEVLPQDPEGDEVGFVTRPIDRNITASATLASSGATVSITCNGMAGVQLDVETSFTGTIVAEVLVGATWRNAPIVIGSTLTPAITGVVNPATGTSLILIGPGAQQVRIRCSAYTSGSAVIYLTATKLVTALSLMANMAIAGTTSPLFHGAVSGIDGSGVARALPVQNANPASTSYAVVTRDAPVTRTNVILTFASVTGVTSEALATMQINKGGVLSSGTTYTVTTGKTFRIQSMVGSIVTGGATGNSARLTLRSAAAVTVGSAQHISLFIHAPAAVAAIGATEDRDLYEGYEIASAQQVGISHQEALASGTINCNLVGYEY